jgi:hypothetical protein
MQNGFQPLQGFFTSFIVGSFSGPIEVAHYEELQSPEHKKSRRANSWGKFTRSASLRQAARNKVRRLKEAHTEREKREQRDAEACHY